MTLNEIISFTLLSYYDNKVKNWIRSLIATVNTYFTAEDDEVIAGTKNVGDIKIEGHDGLMTIADKEKLMGVAFGAQANVIESVSINNTPVTPNNKNVNIDISGKANIVASATNGNFAGLNSGGDLIDSGKKYSDFATNTQGGYADSALQSVSTGTIGSFMNVSVASKTGNNGAKDQAINVSVVTKDPAAVDVDSSHNGLVTALDVKNFVNNKVAAAVNIRGSVSNYSALLSIANPNNGDMYNVQNDETISGVLYPGNMNYVYIEANGNNPAYWDPQSPTINITTATTSQIDSLFPTS